jgi:hypothetical protein
MAQNHPKIADLSLKSSSPALADPAAAHQAPRATHGDLGILQKPPYSIHIPSYQIKDYQKWLLKMKIDEVFHPLLSITVSRCIKNDIPV